MMSAPTATKRPTLTNALSFASLLIYFLYISIVKRVEVELNIEAKEEMIAAAKAAKLKPFIPVGVKFLMSHG